jgi:hypothetical protein
MIKPSRADLFQLSSCLYALTKNVVHMLPFRQVTLNQMLARERTRVAEAFAALVRARLRIAKSSVSGRRWTRRQSNRQSVTLFYIRTRFLRLSAIPDVSNDRSYDGAEKHFVLQTIQQSREWNQIFAVDRQRPSALAASSSIIFLKFWR